MVSVSLCQKDDFVCSNVWNTLGKKLQYKIRWHFNGWIRKYQFLGKIHRTAWEKWFCSQSKQVKLKNFEIIKVVKIDLRGITIFTQEDSVTKKSLKKFIKRKCPAANTATAWQLNTIVRYEIVGTFVKTNYQINLNFQQLEFENNLRRSGIFGDSLFLL